MLVAAFFMANVRVYGTSYSDPHRDHRKTAQRLGGEQAHRSRLAVSSAG